LSLTHVALDTGASNHMMGDGSLIEIEGIAFLATLVYLWMNSVIFKEYCDENGIKYINFEHLKLHISQDEAIGIFLPILRRGWNIFAWAIIIKDSIDAFKNDLGILTYYLGIYILSPLVDATNRCHDGSVFFIGMNLIQGTILRKDVALDTGASNHMMGRIGGWMNSVIPLDLFHFKEYCDENGIKYINFEHLKLHISQD
ncbi:hypothetical protein ACJX0J_039374, partial [Zea mays]